MTPEILRNTQYAREYVAHVALIRESLDQASLSTNPDLLKRSNNQLLRSLGGLLRGASDCELPRESIPVWNLVRVVRTNPDADLVRQTTTLMGSDEDISTNMPSAPMPMPEGDAIALMHPALVTHLTGSKPLHEGRSQTPLNKEGILLEEHASSHSYGSVEVSTSH